MCDISTNWAVYHVTEFALLFVPLMSHLIGCSIILMFLSLIPYNVACSRLYSSEEEEQSQGEGNAQVQVDKVVKLLNQLFSTEIH